MNVTVVIPAYNEEQALPMVLGELKRQPAVREIVVVDNGSTDKTFGAAQRFHVKVVFEPRRGYGQACQAGMRAVAKEADVIVFLDGGYSDYSEDLPALLAPIERGEADLVVGSRKLGQAAPGSLTQQQRFSSRLACQLIALRFKRQFTDVGPFRAVRRDALQGLAPRDPGAGWNAEMQVKALKAGLRVIEVPVRYRPRVGQSKTSGSLVGTVRIGVDTIGAILRTW
jgi:glycosyltransferase involved in cell wall biosynthesis